MPTTYAPATPEEVTTVMDAFYSKARIPTGFAVNLSWDPPVRRIVGGTPDPDELAAIRAARVIRGADLDAALGARFAGPPGAVLTGSGDDAFWADPDTGERAFDPSRTIHFVGDVHVGRDGATGDTRRATFANDAALLNDQIAHRVYVGDLIETPADAAQITTMKALLNSVDVRSRWDTVAGNHDYTSPGTALPFLQTFGYTGRHWIKDLPFCRLIGLTSDGVRNPWMQLLADDLAYLDAALAGTTLPCVIVYHAPLNTTVTAGDFPSTLANFHVEVDAEIKAVLNAHDNAYLWVSGHTHTDTTDPDILTTVDLGSREIIHLNCSAIAFVSPFTAATSPNQSPFVTFADDRLYVRWRDHAAGAWKAVAGAKVNAIPPLPTTTTTAVTTGILSPDGSTSANGTITPTVPAGVTSVAGKIGNAWDVPAAGDGVRVPVGSLLSREAGALAFWFRPDAMATNSYLAAASVGGSGFAGVSVQGFTNNTIQVYHRDSANVLVTIALPGAITVGTWKLLYVGWDATGIEASVNAGTKVTGAIANGSGTMRNDIVLGGNSSAGASTDGLFAPAGTFSRKLTQDELTHLAARTAPWRLGML